MKTHYDLLGVAPSADTPDIKRAFRREIARYHPDKVQHLGQEFQAIAAERAAELTEAYRVLMDPGLRQMYDASLPGADNKAAGVEPASERRRQAATAQTPVAPRPAASPDAQHVPEAVRHVRATISDVVRKASLARLRSAVDAVYGGADPLPVSGFDAAFVTKPRAGLFRRADPPLKLLARFVNQVDPPAVQASWPLALKAVGREGNCCLLLFGAGLAPARELSAAIADQRRKGRCAGPVVVPVDVRDWQALFPPETPPSVREVVDRLKQAQ